MDVSHSAAIVSDSSQSEKHAEETQIQGFPVCGPPAVTSQRSRSGGIAEAQRNAGGADVDNKRVGNRAVPNGSTSRARTFGHTLRTARRTAGVSQDELARLSGVDRSAISNYERGTREPNLRTIVRLARALDVAPALLLRDL